VSKGNRRAEWLNWLLHNPTRLFGTTLLGVNIATFFGSEFAREFHRAIGLNPDWSPLSQVILVVIFGELAPMFAARRYAEHVALLGVPLIYGSAKVMAPFIWFLDGITRCFNFFFGQNEVEANIFLTQEELQKILEEQDEDRPVSETEEFNAVTANIFKLSQKDVRQVMEPLSTIPLTPSNTTVAQVANLLQKTTMDYVVIYHQDMRNIVGLVRAYDLIRAQENRRIRDFARPPWFVTQNTTLMQMLTQFRNNNENLGIILDNQGRAEGVVHLEDIVEELFGAAQPIKQEILQKQIPFIERTLPGYMRVGDFNARFEVILDKREELTLSELIAVELGHQPETGESISLGPFELAVESSSMLEIKTIRVTTKLR
jgi:CBS domain containing-hemolysin-like protein